MSESQNPKSEPRTPNDRLIDALLQDYAEKGANADEAFLSNVEAAIDRDEETSKIVAMPGRFAWIWKTGAAACLVGMGIMIAWWTRPLAESEIAENVSGPVLLAQTQQPAPFAEAPSEVVVDESGTETAIALLPASTAENVPASQQSAGGKNGSNAFFSEKSAILAMENPRPKEAPMVGRDDPVFDRHFLGGAKDLRGFDFRDGEPKKEGAERVIGGAVSGLGGDLEAEFDFKPPNNNLELNTGMIAATGSAGPVDAAKQKETKKLGKLDFIHETRDDLFLPGNEPGLSEQAPKTQMLGRNPPPTDREAYNPLVDNEFQSPLEHPLSTFSVDVDTASYTNIRRMIRDGVGTIPKDAVRIEEMINYFSYDYPNPHGEHPFAFALESAVCPWAETHQLLRVGIQGRKMKREQRPAANLVFLLDVSGSMGSANKLPLVKQAMSILVEELNQGDKVSIVVYAGAEGLCLPATRGDQHAKILASLNNLQSGGSTNGGAGIELAYKTATANYIEGGVNRVLLCTDGDFNVGTTSQGELVDLVSERAKTGTFLSVLGFGSGNINDAMLEAITNKGNGAYYYVDTIQEARKVFLQDIMATLVTIAKDVKIQIEFNPAQVQSYRLIGYANRMLKPEDFRDDRVDAGEIGAGHQVTALYEIVPAGAPNDGLNRPQPGLKYQREVKTELVPSEELATLKLRYKLPEGNVSTPIETPVLSGDVDWSKAGDDFQFSAAVALFGMLLRESENAGEGTLADVLELGTEGKGADPFGRRAEFLEIVRPRLR